MDRFGLFNFQLYHEYIDPYVSDLTVNGHKVDLSKDPGWQGQGNHVQFAEEDFQRENYGYFSDPEMIDIYNRMLKETDTTKARMLMRQFDTRINQQAHQLAVTYWYRVVPMRSYVKGWKISPSHYLNQDLANIWLDK